MKRLPRCEEYVNCTISDGTHRTNDILASVLEFWEYNDLQKYRPVASLYKEIRELLTYEELIGNVINYCECLPIEEYSEKLKDIKDKLHVIAMEDIYRVNNEIAPVGCYFGMHPGDGALLGFWEDSESATTIYLQNQSCVEGYGDIDNQRLHDLLEKIYIETGVDVGLYPSCTNHGFIGLAADYNPDEVTETQENKIHDILDQYKYEIVSE